MWANFISHRTKGNILQVSQKKLHHSLVHPLGRSAHQIIDKVVFLYHNCLKSRYSAASQRGKIEFSMISNSDKENILFNNAKELFGL